MTKMRWYIKLGLWEQLDIEFRNSNSIFLKLRWHGELND